MSVHKLRCYIEKGLELSSKMGPAIITPMNEVIYTSARCSMINICFLELPNGTAFVRNSIRNSPSARASWILAKLPSVEAIGCSQELFTTRFTIGSVPLHRLWGRMSRSSIGHTHRLGPIFFRVNGSIDQILKDTAASIQIQAGLPRCTVALLR